MTCVAAAQGHAGAVPTSPESRAPSFLPMGTQDKPQAWIHPVKQNPLVRVRIFHRYWSSLLKTHKDHHTLYTRYYLCPRKQALMYGLWGFLNRGDMFV